MYSSKFKKDHSFGTKQEQLNYEKIKACLKDETLTFTKNFNRADFIGDKVVVEMKSRRCNYNTYATTMIPESKIIHCNSFECKKGYLVFLFLDGLYYTPTEDLEYTVARGGRYDRGRVEIRNDYAYINIKHLQRVSDLV